VTQQEEIAAMKLAVGEPLPPSLPAPTQVPASPISRPTPGEGMRLDHARQHKETTRRPAAFLRLQACSPVFSRPPPSPDKPRALQRTRIFQLAIAIGSTPPSSSRTLFR
jgi:hypothetical protein